MIQEKEKSSPQLALLQQDSTAGMKAWDIAIDLLSSNQKAEVQRLILLCLENCLEDQAVPLDTIIATVENTWVLTHRQILPYSEDKLLELFHELVRENLVKEVGTHGYTLTTKGIHVIGQILQLSADSPRDNRH